MTSGRAERVGTAAILAFGLFMTHQSWRLGLGSASEPGPGFAPFGAGVAVTAVCAFRLARHTPSAAGSLTVPQSWRAMLLLAASLFAYAAVVERVGFGITTFVWLVLLFTSTRPRRWAASITGAAIAVLIAHVLFVLLFRLQLPRGAFGF